MEKKSSQLFLLVFWPSSSKQLMSTWLLRTKLDPIHQCQNGFGTGPVAFFMRPRISSTKSEDLIASSTQFMILSNCPGFRVSMPWSCQSWLPISPRFHAKLASLQRPCPSQDLGKDALPKWAFYIGGVGGHIVSDGPTIEIG